MDIYKELAALRCFTHSDMVRITGSESAAQWQIRNCLEKGYIERVRRDLYAVISMETDQPISNRFHIASCVTNDACVSYHSAFEYYGYANQVFYNVYFCTSRRVHPFDYDGLHYQPVIKKDLTGTETTEDGIRVTSPERTVIDCIANLPLSGGIEEMLRCIVMIPSLDGGKLLEALESYGHSQLYQKAGYILEPYKDDLSIPDSVFDEFRARASSSKTYLYDRQDDFVFHDKWMLYAPENIRSITDKGMNDYDAF